MVQVRRPQQQASELLVIVFANFGRFVNGALALTEVSRQPTRRPRFSLRHPEALHPIRAIHHTHLPAFK